MTSKTADENKNIENLKEKLLNDDNNLCNNSFSENISRDSSESNPVGDNRNNYLSPTGNQLPNKVDFHDSNPTKLS